MGSALLTDPTLQHQYLEYVRVFVASVYSNSSLIDEMTAHVNAIRPFVEKDVFSTYGIYIEDELSPRAADWKTGNFPLLPFMQARSDDIRAQLKAIEEGTYPRGLFVG